MRRLAASFLKLAGASAIGQLIGFAVLAVVSRRIGASNLGAYGFAANLVSYCSLPVSGIGLLAVRDVARDAESRARVLDRTMSLLVPYGLLASVAIFVFAPAIAPTRLDGTMLRILSLTPLVSATSLEWLLQGGSRFTALALIRVSGQLVYGIGAVLLIGSGRSGLYWYAAMNLIGVGATVAGSWLLGARRKGWPRLRVRVREAACILRQSVPFSLSIVMISVYYSIDFVLLGYLASSRSVGEYVAAYKVPMALLGLGSVWVGVFFPHAARVSGSALRRHIGQSTTATLILFVPLCVGGLALGPALMVLLFGGQFAAAGTPFELLMIAVLLGGIDANFGQVLLARDEQRRFALNVTAGAVVNVALNFALIPGLGTAGSALATIAAETVVLALMVQRINSTVGTPSVDWRRAGGGVAASAVMAAALIATPGWPVIPRLCLGVAVFALASVPAGALKLADRRHVIGRLAHG